LCETQNQNLKNEKMKIMETNTTVTEQTVEQAAVCCPNCKTQLPMSVVDAIRSVRQPRGVTYEMVGTKETRAASAAKLPPQARYALAILELDGTESVSEARAMELIAEHKDQLRTKQDPWRIFQYYRPRMIESDILRMKS
jgi:hypothetical protein